MYIIVLMNCSRSTNDSWAVKWGSSKIKPRFNIKPQFQGRFEKSEQDFELIMFQYV